MLTRLFRHRRTDPPPTEILTGLGQAGARNRVALMVLALVPRLGRRIDPLKCLQLAAVAGLTPETASRLGGPLPTLVAERTASLTPEARLVATFERLEAQLA